jgi:hypothetical protein
MQPPSTEGEDTRDTDHGSLEALRAGSPYVGHAWAWTSGQPRARAVFPGQSNPVIYVAKC